MSIFHCKKFMEKYRETLLSLGVVEPEFIHVCKWIGYAILPRQHLGQKLVETVELFEAIRKKVAIDQLT